MNLSEGKKMFEGKKIVVTGGLGSIGSEIIRGLLKYKPKKITLIDNRENSMFYSRLKFPSVVHEMADIRDYDLMESLLKGADLVFHIAAMKHVILCEEFPFEAIKTNVLGTKNIVNSCLKNNVDKMILISTDKASNPLSMMGATKLLAEKMVGAIATTKRYGKTKFGIIRFGNVLYTRGSVLEVWDKQLEEKNEILLTNGKMTRFFMSIKQSVDLIFSATNLAKDGEIFILKMNSVRMGDFIKVFLKTKGISEKKIKVIGAKKGEKMNEQLVTESDNLILENKKLFISLPPYIDKKRLSELKSKGFKDLKTKYVSSEDKRFLLSPSKIKDILLGG